MNEEETVKRFREFIKQFDGTQGIGVVHEKNGNTRLIVRIGQKDFKKVSPKIPKEFEGFPIELQKVGKSSFLSFSSLFSFHWLFKK